MSTQTRVILWSAPRCTSTVFEHSIGRLPGVKTFHEVYTNAAYFGEERTFPRYAHEPPQANLKFSDVRATLEAPFPDHRGIFCKEMAYNITNRWDALPSGYQHSFLIRPPCKSVTSMYRLAISGDAPQWSDFDPRETGFCDMWKLYEHLLDSMAAAPIIIDSDELLSQPGAAMQTYCAAVGLIFDAEMLQWDDTESRDRLARWGRIWYKNLLSSRGFTKTSSAVDEALLPAAIEAAQPFYDKLYARRVQF